MSNRKGKIWLTGVVLALTGSAFAATDADTQAQLDAIKAAIPKFAVPMREVGDRFQDMYFAAKGGNWALAAYMSKYMNGAMAPAKLTKSEEYKSWQAFYEAGFAPVNKAIQAKDLKGFEKEYTAVIETCNGCHEAMGYGFVKVVKLKGPADPGISYAVKSEPGAVPK